MLDKLPNDILTHISTFIPQGLNSALDLYLKLHDKGHIAKNTGTRKKDDRFNGRELVILSKVSKRLHLVYGPLLFKKYGLTIASTDVEWNTYIKYSPYIQSLYVDKYDFFFELNIKLNKLQYLNVQYCTFSDFPLDLPSVVIIQFINCNAKGGFIVHFSSYPKLEKIEYTQSYNKFSLSPKSEYFFTGREVRQLT